MSQVTFTSKDLDTVLNDFEKTLRTPNRVNIDVISDTMRQAVAENFATESGDGAAWRPLAAETVEEREFLGFPGTNPILFRTGDLLESVTNPNDTDHVEQVFGDDAGFTVTIGTSDPRAGRLNAVRPFLTMDETQEERLASAIDAYFDALFT